MWLLNLLTSVPSLISGLFGTLNGITAAISNEKLALISAKTQQEQIESQERINVLTARRDVLIAESAHSKLNIIVRALVSIGPATFLTKIFLWDKVVGSFVGCAGKQLYPVLHPIMSCEVFNTDALDPNLWNVITIVLGFYFLADTSTTISRIITATRK